MNNAQVIDIFTRSTYPLTVIDPHPDWQVREDKGPYIPNLLADTEYDADPKAYAAFEEHAEHPHKAVGLIDDAWNIAGLMIAANSDESDTRAMQTDAGLRTIEAKLCEAHDRIDRLQTQYMNLFFAYFDLRNKTDAE